MSDDAARATVMLCILIHMNHMTLNAPIVMHIWAQRPSSCTKLNFAEVRELVYSAHCTADMPATNKPDCSRCAISTVACVMTPHT